MKVFATRARAAMRRFAFPVDSGANAIATRTALQRLTASLSLVTQLLLHDTQQILTRDISLATAGVGSLREQKWKGGC